MLFDTDAVPGCTNVALHKFSNDPGLPFTLNPRCLFTQCYFTRIYTSIQRFCAFSLNKPVDFLTRGTLKSLKVSGVTFIKQY